MKRICLMLLCFCFTFFVFAQKQKVAVYVTGDEKIESSTCKILGSELVAAIVTTNEYSAVERTSEFLLEINKEQVYQRSGNVDDTQISVLGKQFGVDLVCVANITSFQDSYYLQVRLIDVENANVVATARETSSLHDITEIVSVSEKLAFSLLKKEEDSQIVYNREYSTYLKSNDPNVFLSRIERRENYTIVYFKYTPETSRGIYINSGSYILDKETNVRYKLISADNIVVSKGGRLTQTIAGEMLEYRLYFEPIASFTKIIDIIETPSGGGFNFYDVRLNPFTSQNEHVFLDYAAERLSDIISKLTYFFVVSNTHSSPRNIYIEGQYVGQVEGYSVQTFKIPLALQGNVESIQASGYIVSPNKEYANISGVKANETITIKF